MANYPQPTRTVNDVMNRVKRGFGDESGTVLEDTDIIMWINEAQQEIVNQNLVLKAVTTFPTVSGQQDYDLTQYNVRQIESLQYGDKYLPEMPMAEAQQRIFRHEIENLNGGIPSIWYYWAGKISLYPIPSKVDTLTLRYTANPEMMTGDPNQFLSVPDKYFSTVLRYVLQQAYEMDEDWAAAQQKQAQFQNGINQLGEEEMVASHMTYPFVTVLDDFDL